MRELSMHILDIAMNSIAADATRVEIEVTAQISADLLIIQIRDNGRGMDPEFLAKVRDPFTTTRRTRRVGLGIPMFAEAARSTDGGLSIESEPGKGTVINATFGLSHIDRAPLGDMAGTIVSIVAANPDVSVRYTQRVDGQEFILDTDELKEHLDGVPLHEGPVLQWIREYVKSGTSGDLEID